jgi:hypothetical protein
MKSRTRIFTTARPHEPEQHDGEDRLVAKADEVLAVDGVEERARFVSLEHRGLALVHDEARAAHCGGGVHGKHAALREPVQPVAKGGEVELGARHAQRLQQLLQVRRHDGGAEAVQRHLLFVAPGAEAKHGTAICVTRMRVRNARREEIERVLRGSAASLRHQRG